MQVAAENRRHRRRNREDDHHVGHGLLRQRTFEAVADDRARHHHSDAARQALHQAGCNQHFNRRRQRAGERRNRIHRERYQHHRAAAHRVRDGAMPQTHHGKACEVSRERLLCLQGRCAKRRLQGRQSGQKRVDRKRPDSRQGRQQQNERAPACVRQRIDRGQTGCARRKCGRGREGKR